MHFITVTSLDFFFIPSVGGVDQEGRIRVYYNITICCSQRSGLCNEYVLLYHTV